MANQYKQLLLTAEDAGTIPCSGHVSKVLMLIVSGQILYRHACYKSFWEKLPNLLWIWSNYENLFLKCFNLRSIEYWLNHKIFPTDISNDFKSVKT